MERHITRDYSAHRRSVIRPNGEYVGLEIFSYDPQYTQMYLVEDGSLQGNNTSVKTSWKSWSCYKAKSPNEDMDFIVSYYARVDGDYRIDFLYEQSNHIWTNVSDNTSKDLTGHITVGDIDDEYKFDGENNLMKRIPVYTHLSEGTHDISVSVPINCYFLGIIVRKIVSYTANNYFGADAGKDSGNMMLTSATLNIGDMVKPSELTCTIGYDSAFECEQSPSGFYIDYMDEVNFYVRDNDNVVQQVFGGYVSSILPNADRTELSLHCADRLNDGVNRYLLDELQMNGGTKPSDEVQYSEGMLLNFRNYAHILKYLCDVHEVTLKSNISNNYLVEGEEFNEGLILSFGSNKSITSVKTTNGKVTMNKNFVTIRNNNDGTKKQTWTLYDASKSGKVAPNITNRPYMHITYGLGSPKNPIKSSTTKIVDVSDTKAGVQKFTKCGVSQDKKYVMGICKPTKNSSYKKWGNNWVKRIFKNKCPYCGNNTLRWDNGASNGCWHGKNKQQTKGEGRITCEHCDADFDGASGEENITSNPKKLTSVTNGVKSSKTEWKTLTDGKMTAIPKTGVEIKPDEIFKSITKTAFKYKYNKGTSSSYSAMKKSGSGDCWAFSDLIFTELKTYGVACKIVQYATTYSNNHRSVMYKDANGKWKDFPYREYGWNTKYNNMLNNTSGSKNGSKIALYDGVNIGKVTVKSKTTTKKETITVTTTKGYDKDKPFQGYLKLTYSYDKSFTAPKKTLYVKFTVPYTESKAINNKGFPLYWINNTSKKATLLGSDEKPINLIHFIQATDNNNGDVYLQSVQMIAPKLTGDTTTYYTNDKSNHDESSCKMDLYQIAFDDDLTDTNSKEQGACGKTVNSMMQDIVAKTGYLVSMTYGKHRKDDLINFRTNHNTSSSFLATEGDNNNILSWNSISYSPVSSMFNSSVQVYQNSAKTYYYVDTRDSHSILEYGEQTTLQTSNEPMSKEEAYYNARMNDKYSIEQSYTYTITVPNYPHLRLGDLVQVIANAKKLNSVKEIKSIKITFDWNKMPRIQTELGLGELAPDFRLKETVRTLKRNTRNESTAFTKSAIPINDIDLYEWDR